MPFPQLFWKVLQASKISNLPVYISYPCSRNQLDIGKKKKICESSHSNFITAPQPVGIRVVTLPTQCFLVVEWYRVLGLLIDIGFVCSAGASE